MELASVGISMEDLYLFNQGELYHSYQTFGAHRIQVNGQWGVRFVVWAPYAERVRVAGPFNNWEPIHHTMERIGTTGVWWTFMLGMDEGELYKYEIITISGEKLLKSDPFAFYAELRPGTASVVKSLAYEWQDEVWMQRKREKPIYDQPLHIYEVH